MNRKLIILVSFLIIAVVCIDFASAQCVMCGASVESSDEGEKVIVGLKRGIGYLMLFPYVIMGTVAYFWYRNYKKTKRK